MTVVADDKGGVFFLYGYGRTGKTFLWRTLSAALRSKGVIVLTVASSGIASLLLPGGRTAHSRFAIPINVHEDSTCNITQGSPLAEFIIKSKLIIWDESPMMHKHYFEAVDRTLRDLLRFSNKNSLNIPFGGKVIIFGGDFRQILPVIPKGTRQDIVNASINSSYLWRHCKLLTLTRNMRIHIGNSEQEIVTVKKFSEWILKIEDGTIGNANDSEVNLDIPVEFLISSSSDPIASLVETTYPSFLENMNVDGYQQNRAILAPTNEIVDRVNEYMLSIFSGEIKTYLGFDSACSMDETVDRPEDIHTPEYIQNFRDAET